MVSTAEIPELLKKVRQFANKHCMFDVLEKVSSTREASFFGKQVNLKTQDLFFGTRAVTHWRSTALNCRG